MEDKHHQNQNQNHQTTPSRLGLRNSGGEIVEVQGGHIVRSTGRKDRHSKVCTAKGPRDRRVRLSANTAIQFYDVQDRLGYDRPSKAVDWLIKKAKPAIDELAELPAWNPTISLSGNANFEDNNEIQNLKQQHQQQQQQEVQINHGDNIAGPSSKRGVTMLGISNQQQQLQRNNALDENNSAFLPESLDSDIADTIKSFFPMVTSTDNNNNNSSSVQFHHGFSPSDCNLLSRTNSQSQDLRLSLHSFQDPMLLHHHHQQQQQSQNQQNSTNQNDQQALFTSLGFDGSTSWSENQAAEIGRFQRMVAWNSCGTDTASGGGNGGFVFNSQPTPSMLQPLFGQTQLFSQRGPLQSSNTQFRAWMDPQSAIAISSSSDHYRQIQQHQTVLPLHPSSISGIGFSSGVGGYSGFHFPARIQGEDEEHDGISDKPSSASSDSLH